VDHGLVGAERVEAGALLVLDLEQLQQVARSLDAATT